MNLKTLNPVNLKTLNTVELNFKLKKNNLHRGDPLELAEEPAVDARHLMDALHLNSNRRNHTFSTHKKPHFQHKVHQACSFLYF